MTLADVFMLSGSIPVRDWWALYDAWAEVAMTRSEAECAREDLDEAVSRIVRAEMAKTQAEAALDLAKLKAGVGN